jgi:ABC-type transport system substrate-binding protein
MALTQLDKKKLKKNYKDSTTNTDDKNIVITLSHSKSVTVYYSKAYKKICC